ncbi:DNA-binding transcriptional regulator, LysR family [Jiangella alkaliphila]|uniref:DNA-binding transcriptional regulator, LysR family n=1 Tax=Jiangella alkaliphila TaxID=419479 RepID=A0A1H2KBD5_9ACTN|nr:DNA-binding transcriptional regulator, LysR family [Jiangella alkaliphila]
MSKTQPPPIHAECVWWLPVDLLRHLEAFVAVAEARSFTRGADLCGTPQPVVSRRVAALERDLGTTLLHRTSRQVELTDAGRTLLPHAADLVARAGHFRELAAAARAAGLSAGIPAGPDPRALVAARRAAAAAGVTLTFTEQAAAERAALVRRGRLDVALLPCPPDEEETGAELGAATAADDLRGRRLHLDQLRRSGGDDGRPRALHLSTEDDVPWVRDPVRRAARLAGLLDDQLCVGTSDTEALTCALEYGDAILCTPAWAAAHRLRWRPLGDVAVRRTYAVAGRPRVARELVDAVLPALARAAGLVTDPEEPR